LDDPDSRVEDDDEADHDGIDHIVQCHGYRGCAEQQQDHGITELVGGSCEHTRQRRLGDLVPALLLQPAGCFRRAEANRFGRRGRCLHEPSVT
jgi:hypothetical protein